MEMARSFPFHDDKRALSGPGSRLWTSQSRGSGWTTSRAWNEQGRPGHKQCHQAQGILYHPVPFGVGPGLGGRQQSRWSPWGSMLETTDTRGWVVVAENMPAAYQRRLDVLHLYIQQNRISWHITASQFANKTIEKFSKPWLCPTCLIQARVSVDDLVTHLSFGAWPAHGCLGKKIPPRGLGAKKKLRHRASSANCRVGLGSAVSLAPN